MRTRIPLFVSLALLPSSCLCLDILALVTDPPELPDPDPPPPGEIPANAIVVTEDDFEWVGTCGPASGSESGTQLDAASATFASLDDGTIELDLSADRCLRVSRTMTGGQLQSARFYRFTGEVGSTLVDLEPVFFAFTHDEAVWERDGDGVLVARLHDSTEVPFFSVETSVPFEVEVREDTANRTRQTTRFATNGDVEWRLTVTSSEAGSVQVVERLVDGVLVSETTQVQDEHRSQATCGTVQATPPACAPDVVATLDEAMQRAMKRGADCMKKLDGRDDTWLRYLLLMERWSRSHTWGCFSSTCSQARWCDTCQNNGEALHIDIGYEQWATLAANNPSAAEGVLFHEMMHGLLGYHPDSIVNSNIYDEADRTAQLMRRYTDRVNACEAWCFAPPGASITQCTCAACLEVKVCDERCAGLESCIERDASGNAIMSEAVGAACIVNDADTGEEVGTFHATKAACIASDCAGAGGRCESKSLSCDPDCE